MSAFKGLLGLVAASVVCSYPASPAIALSRTLARKCLEMTMKEYPRPKGFAVYKPGDTGTAKAREEYYRKCVAQEGNI